MENPQRQGTESETSDLRFPLEPTIVIINENYKKSNPSVFPFTDAEDVARLNRRDKTTPLCEHLSETRNAEVISITPERNPTGDSISIDINNEILAMANGSTEIDNNEKHHTRAASEMKSSTTTSTGFTDDQSKSSQSKEKTTRNEAANRFFNELYDKKVNINNNFSDQEIKDIHEAVREQIESLAATIGENYSRFKIQKPILVGSAKEGTQIVRPCEFDFILVLEVLSKQGAVSLSQETLVINGNHYRHVKLEGQDTISEFNEFCDNEGYLWSSHWFPLSCKGLKEIISTAIHEAFILCSETAVEKVSGILKFRRWKPKSSGPAFTIRLVWERKIIEKKTSMEISVDLCPALKVDARYHKIDLPSSYTPFSGENRDVPSALLMPQEGMLFHVTFTEMEISYTSKLSEHHRQCYKLLKYIINGEPFPPETLTNIISKHFHLKDSRLRIRSFHLKVVIWEHEFTEGCCEENDLCHCISEILQTTISTYYSSGLLDAVKLTTYKGLQTGVNAVQHSVRLQEVLDVVKSMSGQTKIKYNYEDFENLGNFQKTNEIVFIYILTACISVFIWLILNESIVEGKSDIILRLQIGVFLCFCGSMGMWFNSLCLKRLLLSRRRFKYVLRKADPITMFIGLVLCLVGVFTLGIGTDSMQILLGMVALSLLAAIGTISVLISHIKDMWYRYKMHILDVTLKGLMVLMGPVICIFIILLVMTFLLCFCLFKMYEETKSPLYQDGQLPNHTFPGQA